MVKKKKVDLKGNLHRKNYDLQKFDSDEEKEVEKSCLPYERYMRKILS